MDTEIKRLLLAFEQQMRRINRNKLNPLVKELSLNDLESMQSMVADARGRYLEAFLGIAEESSGELPDDNKIKLLHQHRLRYEELLEGARALETALQRGYLDIEIGPGS